MFPTQSEITGDQNDCKRDVLQDQYNEILFKVPPPLRDNFRILCTNYIGISPFSFENIEYKPIFRQDKYCFYYSLKVRYCTFYLHWDVIFDPLRLNDVPDFIFHNDFFQFYTTKEEFLTRYVPERDKWDVNNPFSLLTLLIEFHDLYRRVCVADLRSVCLQFKLLQNTTDYLLNDWTKDACAIVGKRNVEVAACKVDYAELYADVHLRLQIVLETTGLPPYPQKMENGHNNDLINPGSFDAYYLTILYTHENASVSTRVSTTPRLNYVLKEMNKLPKICAYSIPRPMRDYINEVEEILRKTIEDAVACYADKKSLVTHLCIVYSDKVLRYDQQFFNSLDLLCESHGYICRVRIILGNHPEEPLQLEFYCLICESEICFYQRPLDIFPLRAEGNYPENLPEHIWVVILEGLDNFKRHLDENHFVAV